MADDIKIRIGLDGDEEIKKKLDSVRDIGKKAGDEISKSLSQSVPTGGLGKAIDGEESFERNRVAADRFREVIHTLHPILDTAGLGLGNLGAFARVAGAGLGALGAAIVGSILVGLAKISDEADKAKRRLDILTGAGKGGGASQAEHLNSVAKELGVLPSDIAPAAETLFQFQQNSRAQDRNVIHPPGFVAGPNEAAASQLQIFGSNQSFPGGSPSNETIIAALKASIEAGRIDRTTPKEASGAFNEFFSAVTGKDGKGLVTVDALDKLVTASPAIADAVRQGASGSGVGGTGQTFENVAAFRQFIAQGGHQTGGAALAGLARVEPDIAKQAAQVPVNLTEALGRVEAKSHGLAEELGNATIRASKFLNETPSQVQKDLEKTAPGGIAPGGTSRQGSEQPASPPTAGKPGIGLFDQIDKRINEAAPSAPTNVAIPPAAQITNGPRTEAVDAAIKVADLGTAAEDSSAELPLGSEPPRAKALPDAGASPPAKPEFEYITPPKEEFHYIAPPPRDEQQRDRLQTPLQPSNTPIEFGQADQPQQPQQVADLSGAVSKIVDAIAAAVSQASDKAKLDQGAQPVSGAGIRGEAEPVAPPAELAQLGDDAGAAAGKLSGLGDAVDSVVARLNQARPSSGGGGSVTAAGGGHITGPGTATSDSIPAMLSDGEYVLQQKVVDKIGVAKLDKINAGHFAEGGFVTRFAAGGAAEHASKVATLSDRFGALGISNNIEIPHFAIGGMPEIASASLGKTELAPASQMEHWGTIDMRSDHGDFKVATERDTMRHLASSAQKAKRFSTGPKPSWYGGTGR